MAIPCEPRPLLSIMSHATFDGQGGVLARRIPSDLRQNDLHDDVRSDAVTRAPMCQEEPRLASVSSDTC